ncbi:MAG TPA: hypothetical protein VK857_12190 [Desulforhopalus sp.]|nr:hypothetical protein [Desulforhopalus sp.]
MKRAGAVEIVDIDNTTHPATRRNAQITTRQGTLTGPGYLE